MLYVYAAVAAIFGLLTLFNLDEEFTVPAGICVIFAILALAAI